jgi:hypothetical protein
VLSGQTKKAAPRGPQRATLSANTARIVSWSPALHAGMLTSIANAVHRHVGVQVLTELSCTALGNRPETIRRPPNTVGQNAYMR